MTDLRAAILTAPPLVNLLGIGSFLLLLLKIMVLDGVSAPASFVYAIGPMVESLLGATVAAYVFFLISYQYPLVTERRRVGRTVVMLAKRIANDVRGFLQMIEGSVTGGLLEPSNVRREDVERLFSSVSPNGMSQLAKGFDVVVFTWLGAMAAFEEWCPKTFAGCGGCQRL